MIVRTMLGSIAVFWCGVAGAQLAEPAARAQPEPARRRFRAAGLGHVPIGTRFGVTGEVANHYRFSLRGNELLMLDGETVRTNLVVDAWVRERLVARRRGAVLPASAAACSTTSSTAGTRRSACPTAAATRAPRASCCTLSASRVAPSFMLTEPQSGIGDTQVKFARLIGRDQGFVVQASVKLPTGEEDMLAGSGSGDWALTLLRTRPLLARKRAAGYFWGVGLVRAGDPQRIDFDAQTWVPTGIVGGSWQVLPKFGLRAARRARRRSSTRRSRRSARRRSKRR